jgi:hypothetical protein
MPLFTPPHDHDGREPLIFLAGPIQGAPDWQADAVRHIRGFGPDVSIASPRRLTASRGEFDAAMYHEQVTWEHRHLEMAATDGVILFWLAAEAEHRCDRAYAQTTRLELGIALGWHQFRDTRVVVGIEEGFSNARYIRHTLNEKYPAVPLLDDLRLTCAAAVSALPVAA